MYFVKTPPPEPKNQQRRKMDFQQKNKIDWECSMALYALARARHDIEENNKETLLQTIEVVEKCLRNIAAAAKKSSDIAWEKQNERK